jgi:imidazolonepropionase-like amidohydrolase
MKAGLAREAAWKALTSGAGEIANAPVGSLAVGRAADMVLWSGDPLDLTSQVERVWIEGKQVHGDDDQ